MKLHFTNEWLKRTIAADPDVDIEAGPAIDGDGGHLRQEYAELVPPADSRTRVQLRIGLGVLVRKLRTRDGLSITELARRAEISEDELRQVEHNPHYTARPHLISQLSDYFSVPLVALSQMAGTTGQIDHVLYNETVRYAAYSDDLETMSKEERAALDAFVATLVIRAKA